LRYTPAEGMLIKLWKILEESGTKWKNMITFVPDSVKEKGNKQ
jgi:hypothetical protein